MSYREQLVELVVSSMLALQDYDTNSTFITDKEYDKLCGDILRYLDKRLGMSGVESHDPIYWMDEFRDRLKELQESYKLGVN